MSLHAIAIVGASLAGKSGAAALRREGYRGRLTVFGDEQARPYDRPPLSKEILRGEWDADRIALRPDPVLDDVDWRLGVRVTGFDAATRTLGFDHAQSERFDGVMIATGARPRRLPGSELAGVHILRTLDEALALRADLVRPARRVAVVGGGFIGQEVAAACRKIGLEVVILEAVLPATHVVGPDMAHVLADFHRARGVDVRLGAVVAGFEGESRLTGVRLADGELIEADVAVVGVGVLPNTEWLEGSGLTLENGVMCDETCLAAPGVVAAGDVARWVNPRYGDLRRVEHWDNAVRQAEHAARRLLAEAAGAPAEPYNAIPWFWSDQYGLKMQLVGSTLHHEEVRIVEGSAAAEKFVALYRRGDRLVAAFALASPARIVKLRRLLETNPLWNDGLALAA